MADQRRIPQSSARAGHAQDTQQILRQADLDKSMLTLTARGKLTINVAGLVSELERRGVSLGGTTEAADVDEFAGAGTSGLVPDPLSESSNFLRDDGSWAAPSGGGDMLKATYDTDGDNIVDQAEELHDGTDTVTAAQARAHIDSTSNPHSVDGTNGGGSGVGVYDGTTASGLEFRNVVGVSADGVSVTLDAGNKEIDIGLTAQSVPEGKLTPASGGQHVLVSDSPQPKDPEWLSIPDFGILLKKNASASAGVETDAANNNEVLMRGTAGAGNNMAFKPMLRLVDSLMDSGALAGSAFPSTSGSPQEGQPFYRTDLDMLFVYYAGSINAWLSAAEWTVDMWGVSAQNTGYLLNDRGVGSSSTYGHAFRFDVVTVEMEVMLTSAGNGTWAVYDAGTTTGDNVSTTGGAMTKNQQKITSPSTINGGNVIAINQTAGSSLSYPRVRATFRRIES